MPMFLHGGFAHIVSNSFGLFFYGFALEREYGIIKLMLFYFVSGLGGNLISGLQSPDVLSVGASGALFGLFPLMIINLINTPSITTSQRTISIVYIIIMVSSSFIPQNSSNTLTDGKPADAGIDKAAHLGNIKFNIHFNTKFIYYLKVVFLQVCCSQLFSSDKISDSIILIVNFSSFIL